MNEYNVIFWVVVIFLSGITFGYSIKKGEKVIVKEEKVTPLEVNEKVLTEEEQKKKQEKSTLEYNQTKLNKEKKKSAERLLDHLGFCYSSRSNLSLREFFINPKLYEGVVEGFSKVYEPKIFTISPIADFNYYTDISIGELNDIVIKIVDNQQKIAYTCGIYFGDMKYQISWHSCDYDNTNINSNNSEVALWLIW